MVLKLFYYSRWHQLCLHEWSWGNTKIHKSVIYKDNHRRNSNIQSKNTWDLWNAVHFFSTWISFRLSQLKLEADRLFKLRLFLLFVLEWRKINFSFSFRILNIYIARCFTIPFFDLLWLTFFHHLLKDFFMCENVDFYWGNCFLMFSVLRLMIFFVVDAFKSIKIALSFDIHCAELCQVQGQICGNNIVRLQSS